VAVYLWARRWLGALEAVAAVFLFTFLPPVLAHAGVVTTDMALTAFVTAAFVAALYWIANPTRTASLVFGAMIGLAVLSKFSALPFLPAAMTAALAWYAVVERSPAAWWLEGARKRAVPFALAVLTGALVIWAGYRFSFAGGPAPELFAGIRQVIEHNQKGHSAYLLGHISNTGWWYFFPVILWFKTPLAFLGLFLYGAFLCLRRPRATGTAVGIALMFSLGILLFSMTSRINIGVRHILPVYAGFSLAGAAAVTHLMELASRGARWAGCTLTIALTWMAATSLLNHPDYLAYFNFTAGSEPEKIAVDSDLDWGQDMKRLGARLREAGATEVAFTPFVLADLKNMLGFPPVRKSDPLKPSPGWNAVSVTEWKESRMALFNEHPELKTWPDEYKPRERIGTSILLYYFPPGQK